MPRDKDFKRLVRARMKKTGEAYTTARTHLLEKSDKRKPHKPAPAHVSRETPEPLQAKQTPTARKQQKQQAPAAQALPPAAQTPPAQALPPAAQTPPAQALQAPHSPPPAGPPPPPPDRTTPPSPAWRTRPSR
jgi:hypothetical protein